MARPAQRLPTYVNGALALVLIVLVAAFALVVRPPAPPGIAEFAPQASKPITKAPPGQASRAGTDDAGSCAASQVCAVPTPSSTARASDHASPSGSSAPSALQCYTWPDGSVTQTFDPQSPPCIADWSDRSSGNGGATSNGVSSTVIRIGYPEEAPPTTAGGLAAQRARAALVDFFNARFQLHGRKLELVKYKLGTDASSVSPEAQHATGRAAGEKHLFATVDYDAATGGDVGDESAFVSTLVRERVISVSGLARFTTDEQYAKWSPYAWTLQPTWDQTQRALGGVVCRELKGGQATHSAEFGNTPRKFGVLVPSTAALRGSPRPSIGRLTAELHACGVTFVVADAGAAGCTSTDPSGKQQMADWKSAGVTTVLWITAQSVGAGQPMCDASSVDYSPEWLVSGTGWAQVPSAWGGNPPNQLQALMTLMPGNPYLRLPSEPFVQALSSMSVPPASGDSSQRRFYQELQAIAAGIQMAGPRLTPDSFAASLRATGFPNPGAARAPYYQATIRVGQGSGLYADFGLGWWSNTAPSREWGLHPQGAFCLAARGARWAAPALPHGNPGFFDSTRSTCV
jgi:hypothetical protein